VQQSSSEGVTDPTTQLTGFRAAEQASFDRVVFQFRGRIPGYDVRYVPALTQDPSDQPVPLQGRAVLRVVLRHANTNPGLAVTPSRRWWAPSPPTCRLSSRSRRR
jgi:hypothetical protein